MKIYIKKTIASNFELLETPDKELGKGGQARVYKIQTRGYEDYCLKKFIREEDAKKNYDRIAYMIQHPPQNIMGNSSFRICWPIAFAYDLQKNFIGYVMPLAFPNSRDLKILEVYNAKPISQQAKYKRYPDWFGKYELDTDDGLKNRLKMLCNWAIAIYSLHETHKYVVVDLKPENVMATSSGKISIVDTDSFQISENGKLLYPGAAYTPAYFPPEGKAIKQSNTPFPSSCDCFSAAICFYKILVGVHPYGGTVKKHPYDRLETEEEFIREGLFAYGDKKQFLSFNASFNLHKNFENLLPNVQNLFIRSFGQNPSNRPTMEEWGRTLYESATYSGTLLKSVVKPVQSNAFSIKITGVQFGDEDENSNLIRNYGSKLYTDVCYLKPRITVQVLTIGQPVEVWYKIYSPSGTLQVGVKSKVGYTWKGTVNRNTVSTQTVVLGGYGGTDKNTFSEIGAWRIEFYENDRCLYKTTFEIYALPATSPITYKPFTISTPKSSSSSPAWKPMSPSPINKKKKKSKWWLWILFLGFLWAGYEFWFKDYLRDKDASRTYVYATNLFLRSSKDAESDNNRRGKIPYGTKLITYSNVDGWAEVKYDGETGYVSSDYLLEPNDFHLLDGVWGNEEAKEVVITSKCRMAILDYLKKNNWQTGTNAWQIYTKQKEMKPNSVLYPSLNDGYDDFSEFAFILTDNRTKKRTFVLYAFEKDETPIFRYMEEAPDKGDIRSVSYSKWNNKYRVVYSGQGNTYISDKNNETKPKVQSQSKDIEITKVMFANVDYDNKVIATYGAQLYQDTKYLKGKVDFKRGTDISGTMKFQIKILRPDGSMMRGNISPNGYTFEQNVSLSGNGGHFFTLGWGNNEGNIYSPGTYAYEIWYNGQKIYETTFVIENKTWGVETEKKNESKVGDDDEISQWAEQMPEFPGGMAALTNYVQNKIKYPSVAQKNGVQGRVVVSFVVEKDGSVLKANILKGVDPYLDKEALRVVLSMPKWKPAMQAGKKVRCKLTVPVNFKLTE